MRRILVPALAVLVLGIGASAYYLTHWRTPEGAVERVAYSVGGGMNGGHSSSELVLEEDGGAILTTSSQAWHGDRVATCVYEVDPALLDRARDIIARRHLVHASTKPMSDLFPLDADTWSLSFTLGGRWYSVQEFQVLSRGERDGVDEMLDLLREAAESGALVSEELSPRQAFLATAEGYTYPLELNECAAATGLLEQLPQETAFEVRGSEVVIVLPGPLDVVDAPLAGGTAGTLAYRASSNELIMACEDFEPEDGLYELGSFEPYYAAGLLESGGGSCSLWAYDYAS